MVHRSLYPRFLEIMTPRVAKLRLGPFLSATDVDVGSLISHQPIAKLEAVLDSAVKAGARVLAGGTSFLHPDYPQGAYFQPTLIADVTMDMAIAKEELFAPVMTVVPYDDVDEAIDWLNRGRFGLGGSVFGRDRIECRKVAARLECGMVAVNE
jgi:acyl-CoA reductase-like NAD-dependent aldehyde dehydrogenase